MPAVVLLSNHVYDSPRRAGFHWLADAFADAGWDVVFVTTGVSLASFVTGDARMAGRSWGSISAGPGVRMMIEPGLLHPIVLPGPLDRVLRPLMSAYGTRPSAILRQVLRDADLVIVESSAALMFVPALRAAAPRAKLAYRVSDDIRVVKNSPLLHAVEDRVVASFDCISVPSRILLDHRFSALPSAHFHPHGLQTELLDRDLPNPFGSGSRPNLVSLGSTLFDGDFMRQAAERHPELAFHIVGKVREPIEGENVFHHGEVPFLDAIAFAQHADVCLAPYRQETGAEYLVETSNKLAQYGYLRKPIIAPEFLVRRSPRPHVFGYDLNRPETIDAALARATTFPAETIVREEVPRWGQVRDSIISCSGL